MPGKMGQAVTREYYAGPTFLNSPPASALPLPRASWLSSGDSGAPSNPESSSTRLEIQDPSSAIAATEQREEQEIQRTWINRRLQQRMWGAAAMGRFLIQELTEQRTDNLIQLATRLLIRNLTKQLNLRQRLDIVNKGIEHEGTPADDQGNRTKDSDEVSLASADDDLDQMDVEIDGYEFQHEAVVLPRNLILAQSSGETVSKDPEGYGVGDDVDADQELVDGDDIVMRQVVVVDEGYSSQEEQS